MAHLLIVLMFSLSSFAIDWQGHRGARGLYPENTIGAMEEALKYPVTTLELDVVVSKDNIVVVSHEPWMSDEICLDPHGKKVKGKEHNLYKLNYDEIVKYDCGSTPHPRFPRQQKVVVGKPTLAKLFETMEPILKSLGREKTLYNIEIKSTPEDEKEGFQPEVKKFSDLVIETIRKHIPDSRYSIQSFDWRVLQYIHTKYPEVQLVALKEGTMGPDQVVKELGFAPQVYSPYFKDLPGTDLKKFHDLKMKVIPWTVNEISDMRSLIKMGVDGIITDYPDLISEASHRECKKKENFFDGKCVKVPSHSLPSKDSPGWICKNGYVLYRVGCKKLVIPKNAHLLPDGKNWECNPGFERYRGSCKNK